MAQQLTKPTELGNDLPRMTYEEFLAWAGEETRAEWVDGEVTIFEMPTPLHQQIILFLARLLAEFVDEFDLGTILIAPFEMRLLPVRSSREPDIAFVGRDHLDRITADRLEGPADLVVEVISPDSITRDRRDKLLEYQRAGVPEYWIVDPRERRRLVEPYTLTDRGVYRPIPLNKRRQLRSVVLPGFWLDPSWLWQSPLPRPTVVLEAIVSQAAREADEVPVASENGEPDDS